MSVKAKPVTAAAARTKRAGGPVAPDAMSTTGGAPRLSSRRRFLFCLAPSRGPAAGAVILSAGGTFAAAGSAAVGSTATAGADLEISTAASPTSALTAQLAQRV